MLKRFCLIVLFLLSFFLLAALPALAEVMVDTVWVRRYNGPGNMSDRARAIAVDASGNVYVTGESVGSGGTDDYATVKYDPAGTQIRVRRYNGPGNDWDGAKAIAVDDSGNVYVTGESMGSGTGLDYATIKYDPAGTQLWARRYNGPGNGYDAARAIAVNGSGNVYVTGASDSSGSEDYATLKYDPAGNQLWERRYYGAENYSFEPEAIAVDGSGNVYVTGYGEESYGNIYYWTVKYDPAGNQLWERGYNSLGEGKDHKARAIAVDGSGSVYVTGESKGSGTDYDYATVKYDPAGTQLWARRYNGPGNHYDWAFDIAVDGSGNVYVTGQSRGSGTSDDFATMKYYPNGDTAWIRRYNGQGNSLDAARAIAVDGSGSVYVTGYSAGSGTGLDYATVKYDPAGTQLWVQRYNGPGNSEDLAWAIAFDDSGNVYVTGESAGSGVNYDYATIKYFQFVRGDANGDAIVDIGDIVYLINYVFYNGVEPICPSDVNNDDVVDIGDIVYLINYVFYGGPEPNCQ
jgi:uncharacterized delta-60 repeat protein